MINDEEAPLAAFSTPQKLLKELDDLVWELDLTYWDAALHYCEKHNIEVEALAALVNRNNNLKELLKVDCEALNFLPKTTRIPGLD